MRIFLKCLKVLRLISSLLSADLVDNHVHETPDSKSVERLVQLVVEFLVSHFEVGLQRVDDRLESLDQEVNRQVLDSLFALHQTGEGKQRRQEDDQFEVGDLELPAKADDVPHPGRVEEHEGQRLFEKVKVGFEEGGQAFDFLESHQSLDQEVDHHDLLVLVRALEALFDAEPNAVLFVSQVTRNQSPIRNLLSNLLFCETPRLSFSGFRMFVL